AAARAIGSEASVSCDTCNGANVDDAAVLTRNHAARDGLRDKKAAAQVCIEDRVPIFPGNIEGGFADIAARVVYKNVELAEFPFCGCCHFFNAVLIANVEFQRKRAAAGRFDLIFKRQETFVIAAGENKMGTSVRKSARKDLTEAAACAGDDGDASGEIEEAAAHELSPGARTTFSRFGS